MADIVSFGEWVQSRRNLLRYNRRQFADLVGCAPITIKKIERDERRPSLEMAQLLATHLQIPEAEQEDFLRRARGEYVPRLGTPTEISLAEAQTPAAGEEIPRENLPRPTTPFFGRESELAEIADRLADPNCRLLTILAAGGMGKTRLGIAAAAAQLERFTDGVTFVPLAPVSVPEADEPVNPLAGALADALGISFHGKAAPERQLFTYLRRKEMLIVFNNFEHLLATAPFLGKLLSHAPDVKMLITSRERLNLQEEWLFGLQGLSFPADVPPGQPATGFGAVDLFAQRASQVRPSFILEDEYPAILRICRLVEGMPLALELAAAWVFQLSCQEIADEIEAEIDFLTSEQRNLPERHRSIRSVFDYSWEKLNAKERDALQKLSVFRGGFERAAAEAVAGASLPILAGLTGKSLLALATDGRYAIHELLRQFAAEKLAGSESLEQETKSQHAHYFLSFLRRQEPRIKGPETLVAMTAMTRDIDNIRVAIRWAVRHQPNLFDRAVAQSLGWLIGAKGWFLEGETIFRMIVERLRPTCEAELEGDTQGPGQSCLHLSYYQLNLAGCLWYLGRLQEAEEAVRLSPSWLPTPEDPAVTEARAIGYDLLAVIRFAQGDYVGALKFEQRAMALFEEAKDSWTCVFCYLALFNIYILTGDFDKAEQCLARAKQLSSEMGEQYHSRRFWNEMGKLATIRGQLAKAESYFQESLARLEEIDWQPIISFVWRERGDAARLQGNLDLARAYCQRSINLATGLNMPYTATQSLWSLGNLAVDEGAYEIALRYFEEYRQASSLPQEHVGGPGWALLGLERDEEAKRSFATSLQLLLDNQARPIGLDALVGMAHLKARAGQLEEALALLTLARTHPSSYFESREKARKLWEELVAELPAELISRAEVRGQQLDLRATAESLVAEAKAAN